MNRRRRTARTTTGSRADGPSRRPAVAPIPRSAPVASRASTGGDDAAPVPTADLRPTDGLSPPLDGDRTDPATARPLTLRSFAFELWHGFFRTGVTGLATQFAYSLLFAAFPVLLLIMSLAALVNRVFNVPVAGTLRNIIDRSAPLVIQPLLRQLIEKAIDEANTGTASVSAAIATVLAVWGASGAVGALVGASARAYGVRTSRSFPVRRLINALLAMIIIVLIVVAAVLFVFGEVISRRLADWLHGGGEVDTLLILLRWFLAVACTLVALLALYRIAPDLDLSFVWLLPGAATATGLWLLLLQGFSALLQVANPGDPYGAFGSLIVLLWFFYLTGVAFMFGAVLNAVLGRPYDRRRRADIARHPEKRLFCADGREA